MATTLPEMFNLEIQKMPDGGYLVGDGGFYGRESGYPRQIRFASTSIEEALKYIKSKLEPRAANTAVR